MNLLGPDPVKIRAMFGSIAKRYDRANTTLSVGIHHRWRRKLVSLSGAKKGDRILDAATGTGDLAIGFKEIVGNEGHVVGSDFCPEMLSLAREKAERRRLNITFEEADVTALPYSDGEFDITSIAFGIRNVLDPVRGLAELGRVTRPGGHVMILEFGQPILPIWKQLYSTYAHYLLPKLGGIVTGRREAYSYLEKSSSSFPCREGFNEMILASGKLEAPEYWPLTGGVAYIYKARSVRAKST